MVNTRSRTRINKQRKNLTNSAFDIVTNHLSLYGRHDHGPVAPLVTTDTQLVSKSFSNRVKKFRKDKGRTARRNNIERVLEGRYGNAPATGAMFHPLVFRMDPDRGSTLFVLGNLNGHKREWYEKQPRDKLKRTQALRASVGWPPSKYGYIVHPRRLDKRRMMSLPATANGRARLTSELEVATRLATQKEQEHSALLASAGANASAVMRAAAERSQATKKLAAAKERKSIDDARAAKMRSRATHFKTRTRLRQNEEAWQQTPGKSVRNRYYKAKERRQSTVGSAQSM